MLPDARCRQCTGKRLSRTIWSTCNKERMSHLCDSTVHGLKARRDRVLAQTNANTPSFRYPPAFLNVPNSNQKQFLRYQAYEVESAEIVKWDTTKHHSSYCWHFMNGPQDNLSNGPSFTRIPPPSPYPCKLFWDMTLKALKPYLRQEKYQYKVVFELVSKGIFEDFLSFPKSLKDAYSIATARVSSKTRNPPSPPKSAQK